MTPRRIVISALASDDEARIISHVLEVGGLTAARALLGRFTRARRSLRILPDRGRLVPELDVRGVTAFRELQIPPYRMVSRIVGREVWIVALIDGRRDLTEILLDRARS